MLERWRRRGGGDVDRAWATLLADRNNALGLEAAEAREAAAGAAWEREAAREEGTARLVEVAELDLWDAARQGGEGTRGRPPGAVSGRDRGGTDGGGRDGGRRAGRAGAALGRGRQGAYFRAGSMGGLVLVLSWLDDTKYEVTTNRLAPLVDLSMDQRHSITSAYTLVEI